MNDTIILTDNGKKVLDFMQKNDKIWVGKDMIDLVHIKGIYAVLNSLIKHGLVENSDPVSRDFVNGLGQAKPKVYKTYVLTDFGRKFLIQ